MATLVRPDLEGDLFHLLDAAVGHFAKRLSTDVAWHVFDVQDLTNVANGIVTSVSTEPSERAFYLHYRPQVEVLDWSSLRQVLQLGSPLAAWRAARLAHDLCVSLKTLHEEDVPQMVVHPERLGQADGRFIILPTMAGVLPPFPQICANPVAAWLYCVAPEVLRTRGIVKELLFAGDVYSLGRMLQLLCDACWRPDQKANLLKVVEQRVERPESDSLPALPAGFEELQTLWGRASALVPAERPRLDEMLKGLRGILDHIAPENVFARLLGEGRREEAEQLLQELEEAGGSGIFTVPDRTLHLMASDLAMARTPPDCGKAIIELDLAESPTYYEQDVQHRLARAYARFTANPQHLQLSLKAYERAGWSAEVLDEWVAIIQQLQDFDYAERVLAAIPTQYRTRQVSLLLIECLLRKQEYMEAWREVASLFPERPFDEDLYQLARSIAKRIVEHVESRDLLIWILAFQERPGFAAPLAAAYEALGDTDQAAECLRYARVYQPGMGG